MAHDYGEQVRTRRELLGLSQRTLAARAGVTQPMISAIEAGSRRPTEAVRAAVDGALEVRPSVALDARREQVRDAIARHGGVDAAMIGSAARGTDGPDSDLDLLVTFRDGRDIIDLLSLEEELSKILTVAVDVVSAGSTGRTVDHARREAVPL